MENTILLNFFIKELLLVGSDEVGLEMMAAKELRADKSACIVLSSGKREHHRPAKGDT